MALISIAAYNSDKYPTAFLDPTQVVRMYTEQSDRGGTVIVLNVRNPEPSTTSKFGEARQIISRTKLTDTLGVLNPFFPSTPFVHIELVDSSTSPDLVVNRNAIVAVQPLSTGNGNVWLSNGEELFVTEAALGVIGVLPPAVPAGQI